MGTAPPAAGEDGTLVLASDILGLGGADGVAVGGATDTNQTAEVTSPKKKRAKRGRKVWPKKKTKDDSSSSDSTVNDDDKKMIRFEERNPRIKEKGDEMIDAFEFMQESSLSEKESAWCGYQISVLQDESRKKKTSKSELSEVVFPNDMERPLAKMATELPGKIELFYCWGIQKNQNLRNNLSAFMKEGFEDKEHEWIDTVADHKWTHAIVLQYKQPGKRESKPIGVAFFAFIKRNQEYRAAYLDYIHVTAATTESMGLQEHISTFRGNGIGRFLIRMIASVGVKLCPESKFDFFLKCPVKKFDWYKTMGFATCNDTYWENFSNIVIRGNLVQVEEDSVVQMVLRKGCFIPRVYRQLYDYRGITLKCPVRLPKGNATHECLMTIQDEKIRSELRSECPSTTFMLRVPVGKIINKAHDKFHHVWPLETEKWKLNNIEVWFQQKRRKVDAFRRFRHINFKEKVDVTFFCLECERRVALFGNMLFPQWHTLTNFMLSEYLTSHYHPADHYRCTVVDSKRVKTLKSKISEDYGSLSDTEDATKNDRSRRFMRGRMQTESYIGEVMSTLHDISLMWSVWAYPKQRSKNATARMRKQVRQPYRFQKTSETLGGAARWNQPTELTVSRKKQSDASKQWDDQKFQTSLSDVGFVRPARAGAKGVPHGALVNFGSINGLATYWVGKGDDWRALSPEFVNAVLPQTFRNKCMEKENHMFELPAYREK